MFFYTFLPAVICIVVFFVLRNTWSLGDFSFTKFDFWYAALGLLIPLVFQTINLIVQLQRASYAFKADTDLKKVIPIVMVNVVLLIIFVSGEEIGWRGFIQSQAIEQYGNIVGVLLLGLIWGFWHAPVALRGHNLSTHFWAEAFVLYTYMCICYSFPMAYLTIQSGSIWPALIFHATNNALGSISIQFVDKKKPQQRPLPSLVSDAAFPAYVLHFPIVMGISALVVEWPLSFAAKVLINAFVGVGTSLLVALALMKIPVLPINTPVTILLRAFFMMSAASMEERMSTTNVEQWRMIQ